MLKIEQVTIATLKPNAENPRVHSSKQIRQLAYSIQTFQFNVPILIDAESKILAGHGRIRACEYLGVKEIPAIRIEHLSERQVQAFMIADNRLAENSVWDDRLLGEQLKILSESDLDFSLEATGFEVAEIDVTIENLASQSEKSCDEADAVPPLSLTRVSQLGDLWSLGKHRLLCGSAIIQSEYENLMEGKKATMVFADPPYNLPIAGHVSKKGHREFIMCSGEMSECEFTHFLEQAFAHLVRASDSPSLHFICMDWRHIAEILAAGRATYDELRNLCVWTKDNAGLGSFYRSQHELIFVFQRGEAPRNNIQLGRFGRNRTNVWRYPGSNSFGRDQSEGDLLATHPTVKPVAPVSDAIKDCTARGEIVLDPFLGSGTTLIAAERTGRTCFGLELDPIYVDTIVRRWQRFTGLSAVHVPTGFSFDELEEQAHVQRS